VDHLPSRCLDHRCVGEAVSFGAQHSANLTFPDEANPFPPLTQPVLREGIEEEVPALLAFLEARTAASA
jgi:hypothetical protein